MFCLLFPPMSCFEGQVLVRLSCFGVPIFSGVLVVSSCQVWLFCLVLRVGFGGFGVSLSLFVGNFPVAQLLFFLRVILRWYFLVVELGGMFCFRCSFHVFRFLPFFALAVFVVFGLLYLLYCKLFLFLYLLFGVFQYLPPCGLFLSCRGFDWAFPYCPWWLLLFYFRCMRSVPILLYCFPLQGHFTFIAEFIGLCLCFRAMCLIRWICPASVVLQLFSVHCHVFVAIFLMCRIFPR